MAQLIDGSRIAKDLQDQLAQTILAHTNLGRRRPFLTVVLVGEDPASQIYVRHKEKACHSVGIDSETIHKPASISEQDLVALITQLNADPSVDGILVQLPLPKHIHSFNVISAINPSKDVDGLHPYNQGLLAMNKARHVPCTPSGIMKLLEAIDFKFEGKIAAVIGRSILVGSPVARLLLHRNTTVIHIHSKTPSPWALARQADLLVVAVGSAKLIDAKWVREGAVVIDVGIHRIDDKLCGDVDFDAVKDQASWITPVPKGVGPMTIACLLLNCFNAYVASFDKV